MLTINNTIEGYLKDVEIKGNTWQDSENLADIRSVGTKVEGQELYEIPVLIANGLDNSDSNYKEDKLTILSPVQLEKVGDIADRIICKDGVWGVEKNVKSYNLTKDLNWVYGRGTTVDGKQYFGYKVTIPNPVRPLRATVMPNLLCNYCKPVSNFAQFSASDGVNTISQYIDSDEVQIMNTSEVFSSVDSFKNWISDKNISIKYQATQPTFIPLPHDQQIALRTFANKTNISFSTEIEPTIKAQVPKSLGATVNTHTSQIDNLNKELDRVKKLEESTVSTVTSDKAFTSIAETTGGYFEDVKIEGKTLVNLFDEGNFDCEDFTLSGCRFSRTAKGYKYGNLLIPLDKLNLLKSKGKYKVIINITKNTLVEEGGTQRAFEFHTYNYGGWAVENSNQGNYSLTFAIGEIGIKECIITMKDFENPSKPINKSCLSFSSSYFASSGELEGEMLIIEYDESLPQNLNMFEGLKSVGQDTDKIEILSYKYNDKVEEYGWNYGKGIIKADGQVVSATEWQCCNYIPIITNQYIHIKNADSRYIWLYDDKLNPLERIDYTLDNEDIPSEVLNIKINNSDAKYISVNTQKFNTKIYISDTQLTDLSLELNKKEILYFNPNTETWEKPILREWDSIEKHGDGKYYYHKRSGEVVLNGSQSIGSHTTTVWNDEYALFYVGNIYGNYDVSKANCICDKFKPSSNSELYNSLTNYEGICVAGSNRLNIRIAKTRLATQDVEGFKAWLQANNVTVVYELAQEEVYECTNLDLITYQNETNLIVNSGAIQPKLELKVHSNISNIVKLLQEKVSILESDINKYMISQNRSQLDATYKSDSVTFKIDYVNSSKNMTNDYSEDLYNLILDNILVGKDNYNYNHMFNLIMDYASWNKITWEQFDILLELIELQNNPVEELPEELN